MILPSKELLSAVLDKEVIWRDIENSDLNYTQDNRLYEGDINIYELMHLMKEWIFIQGYSIQTMRELSDIDFWYYCLWSEDIISKKESSNNKTEFEAVTKACEWILKEKENK